jgi:hypothetical protein
MRSCGNSVSSVTDYRQESWGSTSGGEKEFSLTLLIQTGSGAHPAYYTMVMAALSLFGKWPWHEADHSPPSSVEVIIDI